MGKYVLLLHSRVISRSIIKPFLRIKGLNPMVGGPGLPDNVVEAKQ